MKLKIGFCFRYILAAFLLKTILLQFQYKSQVLQYVHISISMPIVKQIIFALILIFALLETSLSCELILRTHEKCKKGQNLVKIFEKLMKKYSGIKNQIGETIYIKIQVDKQEWSPNINKITYPSISLKIDSQQLAYQGQPSYTQLHYFTTLLCFHKIPVCESWMRPLYPINIPPQEPPYSMAYLYFLSFIAKTRILKSCLSSSVNSTSSQSPFQPIINSITQLLYSLPLFERFSHNLRAYLLENRSRTAILYLYNGKNEAQVKRKSKFQELVQYIRNQDKRIGYHMSDRARESLIFITHDLATGKGGSGIGDKLIGFLGVEEQNVVGTAVVGIRFRKAKIINGNEHMVFDKAIYKIDGNKVFDNKLIYWLQQLSLTPPQVQFSQKLTHMAENPCKIPLQSSSSPSLMHRLNPQNMSQVLENLHLYRMIQLVKPYSNSKENEEEEPSTETEDHEQKYGKIMLEIVSRIYQNLEQSQQQSEPTQQEQLQDTLLGQNSTKQLQIQAQIQKVFNEQKYRSFKWNVEGIKIWTKQILYSQLPSVIYCENGQQPLRFSDHDQLFQYLIQSRKIQKIPQTSQSQEQL